MNTPATQRQARLKSLRARVDDETRIRRKARINALVNGLARADGTMAQERRGAEAAGYLQAIEDVEVMLGKVSKQTGVLAPKTQLLMKARKRLADMAEAVVTKKLRYDCDPEGDETDD
ncbi:MAG: hypothetical protein AAGK37_19320 [Pseudomonadota bacterium]